MLPYMFLDYLSRPDRIVIFALARIFVECHVRSPGGPSRPAGPCNFVSWSGQIALGKIVWAEQHFISEDSESFSTQPVNQLGSPKDCFPKDWCPKDCSPKDWFGLGRIRLLYITYFLLITPRWEGFSIHVLTSLTAPLHIGICTLGSSFLSSFTHIQFPVF